MEVAVDERRRDEPSVGVDLLHAVARERLADARPAAALGGEVDEAPVLEARVADDEVRAHAGESIAAERRSRARTTRAVPTGRSR